MSWIQSEKVSRIKSKITASVEIPIPMMVIVSHTLRKDRHALEAVANLLRWLWRRQYHGIRHRRTIDLVCDWAGLHVMGKWRGSPGDFPVPSDWKLRVFRPSVIVDRLSELLYIHTIPISVYMNRCSSNKWWVNYIWFVWYNVFNVNIIVLKGVHILFCHYLLF